jgi:hypothetical protein
MYTFSWFFVCTIGSVIYYACSFIGDYATVERSMPFEALVSEQDEILNGVAPSETSSQEGSEINVSMDKKV